MNDQIEEEIRRRILAERTITKLPADAANGAAPSAQGNAAPDAPQGIDHPYYAAPPPIQNPSVLQRKQKKGGIIGAIATLLLLLGKLKFLFVGFKLLTFGKVLLTFGSMLISMWAYATVFGWPFGVGLVILIFVHECGHALAARMRGVPSTLMLFIPFMGAFVATKGGRRNITEDAFIGIMGPVVGTLASIICALIYFPTGNPFWLALAEWGFFINLFNLAPTAPLDGGWITPLFSPKLLAFGVVILVIVGFRNPLIWVLGIISIPRIISGWKADPRTQPYYHASKADKWKFGIAYLGLAALLGVGYIVLRDYLRMHYPLMA